MGGRGDRGGRGWGPVERKPLQRPRPIWGPLRGARAVAVTVRGSLGLGWGDSVNEDGGSFGVGVPAVAGTLHEYGAGTLQEGGGAVVDGEADDGVGAECAGLFREVSDDVLLQLVHDGLVDTVAAVVPGFLESAFGEMGGFPDGVCGKVSEDACRGVTLNRWR